MNLALSALVLLGRFIHATRLTVIFRCQKTAPAESAAIKRRSGHPGTSEPVSTL